MANKFYRPDIDGLRAVAVVLVLLFHGGLSFTGGFVGVDVFFVISGYLITGLIIRQQNEGRFSLKEFWTRRIRRIIPASAVMALVTLIAGAVLLFPVDFAELGKSTIAQQTMLSNVFFWRSTGYFQGPADLKPLLHTWSLAVEEQFYVVYPFILMAMSKLRVRTKVILFLAAGIASLALSVWGTYSYPSATFYLLPTRAWELLIGGILCFLPAKPIANCAVSLVAGVGGLIMILVASLIFDGATRFPGLNALLPCVGTALIIVSNTGQLNLVGRILALKPVVFVGLISYSLYLWHWPILAYARYYLGHELPLGVVLTSLSASFVLAYLSWVFVETPLRRSRTQTYTRPILIGICGSIPVLVLLAGVVAANRGFESRVKPQVLHYLSATESKWSTDRVSLDRAQDGDFPLFGDGNGEASCIVWGDSHAIAIMPGVDSACKKIGVQTYQATYPSTAPLLDFVRMTQYGLKEKSPVFATAVVDFVEKQKIDVVILTCKWRNSAQEDGFKASLEKTINAITDAGAHVIIMLDVADQGVEVPVALAQKAYWELPVSDVGVTVDSGQRLNEEVNAIIADVAKGKATIIEPADTFVDDKGKWQMVIDGEVMFRDAHHLTIEGSLKLEPVFKDAILNAIKKN